MVRSETASSVLSTMLRSPDPDTRVHALRGIAESRGAENLEAVFAALVDKDARVREAAAQALIAFGPDLVFERVMTALCNGDPLVPPKVINDALPSLRDLLETPALAVVASDRESSLRKKVAAYCLGRMGSAAAAPVLTKATGTPDAPLAIICAKALLGLPDEAVLDSFRELRRHPVPEVRWVAIVGLTRVGGPGVTTILGDVALGTSETNLELRKRATQMLGSLQDPGAVPVLIEVLRSQVPLQRLALASLRQLTGQDPGPRASDWIQWYKATQRKKQP